MAAPIDLAFTILKFDEAWHPELGAVLSAPMEDLYVDLTSMYSPTTHPQRYEGMTEPMAVHNDIDNQIRERLVAQGYDSDFFDRWINGDDEGYYPPIDDEQTSILTQVMLDIMTEHEQELGRSGQTIHHPRFSGDFQASEPMHIDLAFAILKNEWFTGRASGECRCPVPEKKSFTLGDPYQCGGCGMHSSKLRLADEPEPEPEPERESCDICLRPDGEWSWEDKWTVHLPCNGPKYKFPDGTTICGRQLQRATENEAIDPEGIQPIEESE